MISFKRIVIKIGSSLIASEDGPNLPWLKTLAADIAALENAQVIIVTSGAVALGRHALNLKSKKLKLEEKQAAAACGQPALMEIYRQAFTAKNIETAQILLGLEDSENRKRYLNARNTLETLLKAGVIPVINENDTVATEELRVGDNDRLAARVAQMAGADLLVLLSDIDGLYTANPNTEKTAKHIAEVKTIDAKIEAMAGGATSNVGTGGMVTKIAAAKIATHSGCHTVIARGNQNHPLKKLLEGGTHTIFLAADTPHNARKRWIRDTLKTTGEVIVDEGAAAALSKGKSLLPAGVKEVKGSFERGDAVSIKTLSGALLGRGLVNYTSDDTRRILGANSANIEEILGYAGREVLIHRDDIVMV